MLHAKFQDHRPSGSGEEDLLGFFFIFYFDFFFFFFFFFFFAIYSHVRHLGLVTLTIYTNFLSSFLTMLHMKFDRAVK